MPYIDLIADDKRLVVYRPRLNAITGSVTATILLQQVLYWYKKNGNKPFYKFNAPCDHALFKPGDSWADELGLSWDEINTARKRIASKVTAKMSDDQRAEVYNQSMIVYWMTRDRLTFYDVNPLLVNVAVGAVYALPAPIQGKQKKLFRDCLISLFRDCLNSNSDNPGSEILIRECLNRYSEKKKPKMVQQEIDPITPQETTKPPAPADHPACPYSYGHGLDRDVGFFDGMVKTPGDLWQAVKDESGSQVNKALAATWLQPSFAWAYDSDGGRLFVGVGNDRVIGQLTNDRGLAPVISRNVAVLTKDRPIELVYIVAKKPQPNERQPTQPRPQRVERGNGAAQHMQY